MWLESEWNLHVAPGANFECKFLEDLVDALTAIEPKFAAGDIELGAEIAALCTSAMEHTGG